MQRVGRDHSNLICRVRSMWLCKELLPFSMTATDGFNDFAFACKMVKIVKDLPSSSAISQTALCTVLYRTVYGELQKKFQMMPEVVSITLDFWTDKTKRTSYVSLDGRICSEVSNTANGGLSTSP